MPSLFVTGANILDQPQVNTATGAGNEGQGTITINNGTTPFEADDFIVFDVQNTTVDGELDGGSGVIGAVVYDTYQDFLDGIPKYTYTPMNPVQEATIQEDLSGLGDNYVRFNANVLTSSDPGAPAINELLLTPGIDWFATAPTSGVTIDRFTDNDFNDSGSIEGGTTEDANGLFSVNDWNAEVLAAADPRDFVVSGTGGDDVIDASYTGDPEGDRVDGNDAADGSNDDVIDAGAGNDVVRSGDGNDVINGGTGHDTIDGGTGNDDIEGGTGSDTFVVSGSQGLGNHATIDGGEDGPDDGTADGDIDILYLGGLTPGVDYTISYTPVGGAVEGSFGPGQTSEDGVVTFADGSTITFSNIELVICFARGTRIETDSGPVAVEDLSQGDMVRTQDRGYQPIRWIGSTLKTAQDLAQFPKLRPIRIKAGSLGPQIPEKDLLVSPQHRMLVRSKIAKRMFGEAEVLVAAKHLTEIDGIEIASNICEVEYFHILFDQHEIVTANGASSESLFTGPQALKSINEQARAEIFSLFPELMDMDYAATPCRPAQNARKSRKLAQRHQKNKVDLVQSIDAPIYQNRSTGRASKVWNAPFAKGHHV